MWNKSCSTNPLMWFSTVQRPKVHDSMILDNWSPFLFRINCFADFIEPTYSISSRGKPILVHDGFRYVRNGVPRMTNNGVITRWRCGYPINGRFGCTAKACTINQNGVEDVIFNGFHCHRAKSKFWYVIKELMFAASCDYWFSWWQLNAHEYWLNV